MPDKPSGEIIMPVPDDMALRQFEIQAMRGILDNLERLNNGQAEMLNTVHQIDARLIRQETRNEQFAELKEELKEAQADIARLKSDRDKRTGAVNLVEWIIRHWPGVLGFFLLVGIILNSKGKLPL
jgi:hypothetical protein